MTEFLGRGDQRRSMELLWGATPPPARGPKPGLSLEAIVAAAIELADAEGLDGLSMRKVADRLGRSPMALYTYVPGKAELLELMLDTTYAELPTDYDLGGGWRAALDAVARDAWAFYGRHPWVLQISGARVLLGPHELDNYEAIIRLLDGLGLGGTEMNHVITALSGFVSGAARAMAEARAAEQATGISETDWWTTRAALLHELTADIWADRYPTLTRLEAEAAFDQPDRPDDITPYMEQDALDTFEMGLTLLLDGLESLIARRSTQ